MFARMEDTGTRLKRNATTVSRGQLMMLRLLNVPVLLKILISWMVLSALVVLLLSIST